jgi:hypothetical protein
MLDKINMIITGWFFFFFKRRTSSYFKRRSVCVDCKYRSKINLCLHCGCYIPAKCIHSESYCENWEL